MLNIRPCPAFKELISQVGNVSDSGLEELTCVFLKENANGI